MNNSKRRLGLNISPMSLARPFSVIPLLVAVAFNAVTVVAEQNEQLSSRANVLIIIADDLGYGETEAMGNSEIPTPAIDALADSGVVCTSGYVTSSYCSPSRAGLMAGRYQSRFGYDHNPVGDRNLIPEAGLPESEILFPTRLASAGYRTGLFGKWHLGTTPGKRPTDRGFADFYGFLHEGHFYVPPTGTLDAGPLAQYPGVMTMLRDTSIAPGQRYRDGNLIRGNYAPMNEPPYDQNNPMLRSDADGDLAELIESRYLTDAITDEAIKFIERAGSQPYLAVVSYSAVHSPMQSKLEMLDSFASIDDIQRRIFAGMLTSLDEGIGNLVKAVRRSTDGQATQRETLIVFISDNGGPTRELTSSNAPLRGEKGSLYEGGIRVPMIWSLPGRLPSGVVDDRVTLSLDIAATSLDVAGVPQPASADGHSVLDWMNDPSKASPHQTVFWRMPGGKAALREGNYKIVRPRARRPFELYDLAADIAESENLAKRQPERYRSMMRRWEAFNADMAPPIQVPQVVGDSH